MSEHSLVIFSDSPQQAYGTVAYARWATRDGRFRFYVIAGTNRIAPVKIVDIVRLELAGAVLGKRLRIFIEKESVKYFLKIIDLVDSQIVRAMVGKPSFNTFDANRKGEIVQI